MIVFSKDIPHLLNWVLSREDIAIDIETTGLNTRKDQIIGFGLSDLETSFYLPIYSWENGSLVRILPENEIELVLSSLENKKLRTWNGAFDLPFILNNLGTNLIKDLHIDGMLLKHTVDEEFPFGLKEVGTKLFGEAVTDEKKEMLESIKKNGGVLGEYYKASLQTMAKYCERDCLLTYKIIEHYLPELRAQGLEKFFFEDEVMPLYREVTIPMEQRGVRLNVPLVTQSKIEISRDLLELEDKIQNSIAPHLNIFTSWFLNKDFPPTLSGAFAQALCELYGAPLPKTKAGNYSLTASNIEKLEDSELKSILKRETAMTADQINKVQKLLWAKVGQKYMFNLSSKHHLKKLFFETLKETPISTTEKGNPQVDDEFLQKMAEKYEWAADLIVFNKLTKINGTYIDRFLQNVEGDIFYPRFMQHRTVSGRYGSDLQQLPRPIEDNEISELVKKHTNRIRKFFICREGHKFIDADYESLEPHVFAHVSGDERIKDIFRSGNDFYSTIAIKTEGLKDVSADKSAPNYLGKVNKEMRQKAKAYSLGIPYGMSGYKLSFELNIPVETAENLVNDYLNAFPDLKKWFLSSRDKAMIEGFIQSEAGRIRHMPKAKEYFSTFGPTLLNSLDLYKEHSKNPQKYSFVKMIRKEFINYLNNACNFQIQSLSASIVNRAALALNRYMCQNEIPGLVICQVHDQLIIEVEQKYALHMKQKMQELMENTYKLSISLKAPANISENFKDGH